MTTQPRNYSDTQLTPYLCDKKIIELHQRGYSYRAIGQAVGMDASGVYRALRRLEAGGAGTRPRP
jgi:transposase-like protein